jgi:hypothetical protein
MYPAGADDDEDEEEGGEASDSEDRDNKDDDQDEEEEEKPASVIQSDEESESEVESLPSDLGEEEVGNSIEIVDGLGTSAQAEACRENIGTFHRSQEHSSSILDAMISRYVSALSRDLVLH